jgi:hypothetical protein
MKYGPRMTIYLSSYNPLTRFPKGREAIAAHRLAPFVDYSCRREPDFTSKYPSITALCRAGKFAPRLREGDIAVYITNKDKYLDSSHPHWRLVAILKVVQRFETHEEAALWYRGQGVDLPANCHVGGNPPIPIDQTAPVTEFKGDLRLWDAAYRTRMRTYGVFLACVSQYLELHSPPIITEEGMKSVFGRIPGRQNPPSISPAELTRLKNMCGIQ